MLGTVVGSYKITGTIGGGGMGVIYRAEHTLIGRRAAVKVLLPEFARNRDIVNRFFNEAKAATGIQHPGIVEIFDFGYVADGSAFIVMEFLAGESLASRARARGRLSETEAFTIIRGIAGALGAAHARGIVHRDIKPDNIFLVPDPEMPSGERVKLLDFGIAKLTDEASSWSQTRTGAVMGTPTYMAPEQCRGAGGVDHRADLYAVGCILFELLSGRPPFEGGGAGEVIGAHQYLPAPSLRSRAPDVSQGAEIITATLLAKSPDDRYQSASDLLRALGTRSVVSTGGPAQVTVAASGEILAIASSTTLASAASEIAPAPRGRRGLVIGAAAACVVIAGIAIVARVSTGPNVVAPAAAPTSTPTIGTPPVATGAPPRPSTADPVPATPGPETAIAPSPQDAGVMSEAILIDAATVAPTVSSPRTTERKTPPKPGGTRPKEPPGPKTQVIEDL